MRASKITALAVAGALGVAGLGAVAVGGSALAATSPGASSTEDGTSQDGTATADGDPRLADRLQRIKDALSGLVDDGSLTQEQADEVTEALNGSDALGPRGHGGPGGHGGGRLLGQGLDA